MTRSTITLEMGLLFFRTFLCMSLRESHLAEKAFPVMNHIFPFAALNASEGLRHKTKWGADDRRWMSPYTQSFFQSKNRSYDLHPAYKVIWPSAYPTLQVMGEHADRQSFKGQAEFSHPGCCHCYRCFQRHTYLLFPCIPSQVFEVKCCNLAHSGMAPTDGPTSHRSEAFPLFLCLSLFVSCRDEEHCFGSLGTIIKALPSTGAPEERCVCVWGGGVGGHKAFRFKGCYHHQKLTTVSSSRDNCLWLSPCLLLSARGYPPWLNTC